jgi:hypothetical protein
MQCKQALVIHPGLNAPQSRPGGEIRKTVHRVLIGALGMYALTGREIDVMPTDVNGLLMRTDQMHLNAPQCFIIKGVMLKSVGIKVGSYQIIHTP